jgi:hypothetical protein
VAEGTLYPQFESKLGLLKALGENDGTGMRAAFTAVERKPSPAERQKRRGPTTESIAGEPSQPR